MRRQKRIKRYIRPDIRFNNLVVTKFVNYLQKGGKKAVAFKSFYGAMDIIQAQKKEPLDIFMQALKNVTPKMELRSKRVGGANYQIPREVSPERALALAMRWLILAARKKQGATFSKKLSQELSEAAKESGDAFKKKIDTHRMAEANRAFAHFAR